MSQTHYIEPFDVLFLRGNKLFGDAGSFGESWVPPWPSVAAGALRSALLSHKGIDLKAFARSERVDDELGTPQQPGDFRLANFQLARRKPAGQVEPLFPLPADHVMVNAGPQPEVRQMQPWVPRADIMSSAATAALAVLVEPTRSKAESGLWLTASGWQKYLLGQALNPKDDLLSSTDLWQTDIRTGIGLQAQTRSVQTGHLFSVQAVSLNKRELGGDDIGFVSQVLGAQFPASLGLRLGGDGRAAQAQQVDMAWPEPDYAAIAAAGRCRIVLTSPGIFDAGWIPNGTDPADRQFTLGGVRGHLCCAAVPRAEVVSGWDLAQAQPKSAQRVAPAGSVYWLDELKATPEQLRKLANRGLWRDEAHNPVRQAEGFNRFSFATY